MTSIESFRGEYFWLSNFYPCAVVVRSFVFKCAEAAYQCAKSTNQSEDVWRFVEMNGAEAKKAGRKLEVREDWDYIKIDIMREVVESKFRNNADIRKKLLDTGDAKLIEGNDWGDTFWGVCNGRGQNWLGYILMNLRDKLRQENGLDIIEKQSN